MNLLKWFMGLFRKKTEDNSFYDVRAEHEQIARELDEWRKNEILRSLQGSKSFEDFKREICSETPQLNLQMGTIGNNIKHFAVDPEEFAKLNLNEIISRNQDNTTALIYGLWQQQQKDIDK